MKARTVWFRELSQTRVSTAKEKPGHFLSCLYLYILPGTIYTKCKLFKRTEKANDIGHLCGTGRSGSCDVTIRTRLRFGLGLVVQIVRRSKTPIVQTLRRTLTTWGTGTRGNYQPRIQHRCVVWYNIYPTSLTPLTLLIRTTTILWPFWSKIWRIRGYYCNRITQALVTFPDRVLPTQSYVSSWRRCARAGELPQDVPA